MPYGQVLYDVNGKIFCEICGKAFDRVLSHARQKHGLTALNYKQRFGLDTTLGLCSEKSKAKSKAKVYENYDRCITANLVKGGAKTRYTPGHAGRTGDKLSKQSKDRLINQIRKTIVEYKEAGHSLGQSGLGNAVRWGAKKKPSVL